MAYKLYILLQTSFSASTLLFNPPPSGQASKRPHWATGLPHSYLFSPSAPGFYLMASSGQYNRPQAPFTAHPRVSGGPTMNQSTSPHDASTIVRSQYPTG